MAVRAKEIPAGGSRLHKLCGLRYLATFCARGKCSAGLSLHATTALLTEFLRSYEQDRQKEYQILVNSIRQLEERWDTKFVNLREDLETLALTAQGEIVNTRRQLGRLAVYTQPAGSSPKSQQEFVIVVVTGGPAPRTSQTVAFAYKGDGQNLQQIRFGDGSANQFEGLDQNVLTIRVKKADVDDYAKDKLSFEEFRGKTSILSYGATAKAAFF